MVQAFVAVITLAILFPIPVFAGAFDREDANTAVCESATNVGMKPKAAEYSILLRAGARKGQLETMVIRSFETENGGVASEPVVRQGQVRITSQKLETLAVWVGKEVPVARCTVQLQGALRGSITHYRDAAKNEETKLHAEFVQDGASKLVPMDCTRLLNVKVLADACKRAELDGLLIVDKHGPKNVPRPETRQGSGEKVRSKSVRPDKPRPYEALESPDHKHL